jgi:hypothetical protein
MYDTIMETTLEPMASLCIGAMLAVLFIVLLAKLLGYLRTMTLEDFCQSLVVMNLVVAGLYVVVQLGYCYAIDDYAKLPPAFVVSTVLAYTFFGALANPSHKPEAEQT